MNRVEITLQDIFWALKKYFFWIVLTTAVFTVCAFGYTEFFATPIYETGFSMGVNSNGRESTAQVTNNELTAEARIAETYRVLITSQPVIDAVSAKLDGAVSAERLKNLIKAEVHTNTMVLDVAVRDNNAQRAVDIANALSELAPKVLGKFPVGGTLYSIEKAVLPKKPVAPNLASNLTVGFTMGLLLSCAVVILIAILDTTIWREEDLKKSFDVPFLGSVPSMKPHSMVKLKKKKSRR